MGQHWYDGLAGRVLLTGAILFSPGCETMSPRSDTYNSPSAGRVYADDTPTQAKTEDSEKSDLEKDLDKIDVSKYDLKWVQNWRQKPIEEILKGIDYVHIDSTKEGWDAKYRQEVFQEELKPEERKPVFVLFYDPAYSKHPEMDKNQMLYFRAMSEVFKNRIKFVQVHLPIDTPAQKAMVVSIYRGEVKDLPPVRGPPSTAIYEVKDGAVRYVDISFETSISAESIVNEISNGATYWIGPLIFGEKTPDGKLYRFNNEAKLKEVASRQ